MNCRIGVYDYVNAWLRVDQNGTMAVLLAQVQQQCTQDWEKQWISQLQLQPVTPLPQERGERLEIPAKCSGELLRLVRRVDPAVKWDVNEAWQKRLRQLSEGRPHETPLQEVLRDQWAGQIGTTGKTESQMLLLELVAYFSDAKVLVCCPSGEYQKKLARYLTSRSPDLRIETGLAKDVNDMPGVFVTNATEFEQAARNPEYDVLVVMEGDLAGQVRVGEALQLRQDARCYAFRTYNKEYTSEQELALLHRCGSVICETVARRDIRRLRLTTDSLPPLPRRIQGQEPGEREYRYKQEHVWSSPRANAFLIELLQAFRDRDWQRLVLLGVRDDRELAERVEEGIEAVLVVENVRHGDELLKMLPEAHVDTRQGARMGQIAAEPEELEWEEAAERWFPRILTLTAAAKEMPLDAVIISTCQGLIPDSIMSNSFEAPTTWILELTPPSH